MNAHRNPEHARHIRLASWSSARREALSALLSTLELKAPTSGLGHRKLGMCSIDHIAVPNEWNVGAASRLVAEMNDRRLSDHDAYVIELDTEAVACE